MKTLIIGFTGHIGSYLVHDYLSEFKSQGHEITAVDNMFTQRYCSLIDLDKDIEFIEDDFQNLSIEFLSKFDNIIHLAAITDAASSFKNKKLTSPNIDRCK